MISIRKSSSEYGWYSDKSGAFVVVYGPGGRSALLQGDDAVSFHEKIEKTSDRYKDADVCKEYDSVMVVAE